MFSGERFQRQGPLVLQLWHDDVGSLWVQLPLQFYTKLFEILQVFLSWSDDVHAFLGLSNHHFYQLVPLFRRFSGPISTRMDTLWAQLILQSSTHRF